MIMENKVFKEIIEKQRDEIEKQKKELNKIQVAIEMLLGKKINPLTPVLFVSNSASPTQQF